jgi:hypothetical protein
LGTWECSLFLAFDTAVWADRLLEYQPYFWATGFAVNFFARWTLPCCRFHEASYFFSTLAAEAPNHFAHLAKDSSIAKINFWSSKFGQNRNQNFVVFFNSSKNEELEAIWQTM